MTPAAARSIPFFDYPHLFHSEEQELTAIFRSIVAQDLASRAPAGRREPATIDAETAAALVVWGAMD